jgi:hypothetical protein
MKAIVSLLTICDMNVVMLALSAVANILMAGTLLFLARSYFSKFRQDL